jgi:N-methylhydantoinase A
MMMQIGVDIGGTFTDFVLSDGDGNLQIYKLPSTPSQPAQAMLTGIAHLTGNTAPKRIAHGSTVATNAILERKGAKTALITTQGFRDVLLIGRQNRPQLYALHPQIPAPLIPRTLCFEVPERLNHEGDVLTALNIQALDQILDQLVALGVESVAVCLLYSYVNPIHERLIQKRAIERGLFTAEQIALSCDVLPEFREYERASTVALEAFVRPVMARYVGQLRDALPPQTGLRIMRSDGGVIGAGRVAQQAIQTALSGPAAGVIGAFAVAQQAGYDQIITLDMGGTSTDVAICPSQPIKRTQSEIDGLPLRVRLLDIETVGAGGGSIARVDGGGALRVGPQSAGANPGPACYGRGGDLATVSDANALLGRLDADHFLGGAMALDLASAERVITPLARQLGMERLNMARGIIEIANTNIERAVRRVSVARGYDPRDFTLVAFGGAGALHACDVAGSLGMARVLIPRYSGVLCAYGLLVADVVIDYSQSVLRVVDDATIHDLSEILEDMLNTAKKDLIAEGIRKGKERVYHPSLDMRYAGQAYELNVPFDATVGIQEAFHQAHESAYGHRLARDVEVVNVRLQAVGLIAQTFAKPQQPTGEPYLGQKVGADGGTVHLYQREQMPSGMQIDGEALIFQMDSTVYVPSGWRGWVDEWHNLILERN